MGESEAENLFAQALALQQAGRLAQALELYDRLLASHPRAAAARINRAACLAGLGQAEAAGADLAALLETAPSAEAWNGLGNALRQLDRFAEAETAYAKAFELAPADPRFASNRGLACQDQGLLEAAIRHFRQACALDGTSAELRTHLGGALLMAGQWREGWPAYEARLHGTPTQDRMGRLGLPIWEGEELQGQKLLLHAEQGLGDTLQFLRFIPFAASRGAQVILSLQPALLRLAGRLGGGAQALSWDDPPPPCDRQAALLSLARLAGLSSPGDIPSSRLTADPLLTQLWGERLAGLTGLRAGLSWQGNPAMAADAKRSIALRDLLPLADLAGLTLVSLQTGAGREQIGHAPLLDLGAEFADMADTAAAMAHLDLVIAVDSGAAHLAGALGRPVWNLVRYNPDWRWPPGAAATPWYPSMRLIRQQTPGSWTAEVDGIRRELTALLRSR
jgi:tetratricopeptide (TPR) repeat protein